MDATRFLDSLLAAKAELGACQSQRISTDDRIIAGHIDVAYARLETLIEIVRAEQEAARLAATMASFNAFVLGTDR